MDHGILFSAPAKKRGGFTFGETEEKGLIKKNEPL